MTIPFSLFFSRITSATGISTQMELAEALGVNRSAVTQAKMRDAVPQKWILALSRKYTLSPDWLEFGSGAPRGASVHAVLPVARTALGTVRPATAPAQPEITGGITSVPKVRARLCAGGGSFEVDAVPLAEYPFPTVWLAKMGNPKAMVFMDVIGNSMEPGILDGDMVLVDQSGTSLTRQGVFAVGVEDALYLKRVEKQSQGFRLLSDNPEYTPMDIRGDELESFRVLGRVVWLCRDCRYY